MREMERHGWKENLGVWMCEKGVWVGYDMCEGGLYPSIELRYWGWSIGDAMGFHIEGRLGG
jgi:hypothetical protein